MPETTYTYSIASDIPAGEVALGRLQQEIQASAILTALKGINRNDDVLDVIFKDALSAGDKTLLDGDTTGPAGGLIGAHTGEPLPNPATVDGKPIVHIDAPTEHDGRPVIVMSPSTEGWMTWFTGAGDDPSPTPPASGRGTGTQLKIEWTAETGSKSVDVQFNEPVEIHDGQLNYTPSEWTHLSRWDFSVIMPATVVTPNGGGTGNCNLVDAGGYNIIVPAAGDGTHDVDLSTAVPVPSGQASDGYWDVDRLTGAVSVSSTPGQAGWHLLDVSIQSYFMRNMPMGNPLGIFDIDTYKAEWISDRWTIRLEIDRQDTTVTTSVAAWLMLFREHST